jgi:hypothetical protein
MHDTNFRSEYTRKDCVLKVTLFCWSEISDYIMFQGARAANYTLGKQLELSKIFLSVALNYSLQYNAKQYRSA